MSKKILSILVLIIAVAVVGGIYYTQDSSPGKKDLQDQKNKQNNPQELKEEQKQNKDKNSNLEQKIDQALDIKNFTDSEKCSSENKEIFHGVAVGREGDFIYGAPSPESEKRQKFRVLPQTLFIEIKKDSEGEVINKKEIRLNAFDLHDSAVVLALNEPGTTTRKAMLVKRIVKEE